MKRLYGVFFLMVCLFGNSQIIRINNPADAHSTDGIQQLVTAILGNGFGTISNFSSTAEGSWTTETKPYGYFNQNGSTFPFQNGLVITSGKAYDGGNTPKTLPRDRANTVWNTPGDDYLTSLILSSGISAAESETHDAYSFEFDFTPVTNSVKFNYLFASSEYGRNEYNCHYFDGIAILVKKAGDPDTNYKNYATVNIGGTTYLVNASNISPLLSIGTTNCGRDTSSPPKYFAGYYWKASYPNPAILPQETNYLGRTQPMPVEIPVTIGQTYHIKFVVADTNADPSNDSALFLEGPPLVVSITGSGGTPSGSEYYVCSNNFTLTASSTASDPATATYQWSKDGVVLSGETNAILDGSRYGVEKTGTTYSVTVTADENSESAAITVFDKSFTLNSVPDFYGCQNGNTNQGTFDLTKLESQLSSDNTLTYSFFTDSGLTQGINNPQNYSSTEKTIYVKAVNSTNCTASQPVNLKITNIPDPVIQQAVSSCQTVLNSNTIYPAGTQFVWLKGGTPYTSVSSVLNQLTVTESGDYSLQITLGSCTKVSNIINVDASANTAPIVNLALNGTAITASTTEQNVCSLDFKITSTVTNNKGTLSYQWSKNNVALSGETASTLSGLNYGEGTYTLSVTDSDTGCTGTSLSVKVVDKSFKLNAVPDFYGCQNGNTNQGTFDLTQLESQLSSDNTLTYSFFIDSGLTQGISNPQNYVSGERTIYVKAVNSVNCTASQPVNLKITNIPDPVIQQAVSSCQTVLSCNTSYPANAQFVWLKDGNPYTSVSSILNPLTLEKTETGSFSLRVTVETCSQVSNVILVSPIIPPTVTIPDAAPLCEGETISLHPNEASNPDYSYVWTAADGTVLGNSYNLSRAGYTAGVYTFTLTVTDTKTGCQATATGKVTINPLPVVNKNIPPYTACDYDGNGSVAFYPDVFDSSVISNPNNYTIQYFDSNGNMLSKGQNISGSQTITARVTSAQGCVSETTIQFNINSSIPVYTAPDYPLCDKGNGTADFNLSSVNINSLVSNEVSASFYASLNDAENGNQPLPNVYTAGNNTTVYAIVKTSGGDCGAIVKINLKVMANPVLTGLPDVVEFCPNGSVVLSVPAGFSNYKWSTGAQDDGKTEITVRNPSSYTVTVYNAEGCSVSHTFTVKYYDLPAITDVQTDDKKGTAIVITAPTGTYEYSLDQINWQSSNIFTGLKQDVYNVWLRAGTQGCIVGPYSFAMLGITNAFTPNGDGINDTWTIRGLEAYPGTQINIFDRYGRTVFEGHTRAGETFSWDGKYKGSPLPTNTYWYIVVLPNGKKITGYVVVKNREQN